MDAACAAASIAHGADGIASNFDCRPPVQFRIMRLRSRSPRPLRHLPGSPGKQLSGDAVEARGMADQPRDKSDNENRCRPKKSHIPSVAKPKRGIMDGLCCRCSISRGVFDMSDQRSRVRTASQKSNSPNCWQLHSFRQSVPSMRRKLLTKKPRLLNEKQLSREQQSALANAKAGIEQRVADAKAELIRRRHEHDDPLWLPRVRVEPYLAVGHYEFGPQRRLRPSALQMRRQYALAGAEGRLGYVRQWRI